jgi:hypothetical protein
MPHYQLYCVDGQERIQGQYAFDAGSDRDAVEMARSLCGEFGIEAWEGDRLVARLPKDGASSGTRRRL